MLSRLLCLAMSVLCGCLLAAAEAATRPQPPPLPPSLAQYASEQAVLLRKTAPGAPGPLPKTIYPREELEARWRKLPEDPELQERAKQARARADRYASIPKERWDELLPDRSPAPYCDFPNAGSSGYLTVCPVTGARLENPYEPFDIINHPFSLKLKANGRLLYELEADHPADYPYPIKGAVSFLHWDGRERTVGYLESPGVQCEGRPLRVYPANLVWRQRLTAVIGAWGGGVLPNLADAYVATGDERYAETIVCILERLAQIVPNFPLAYYNAVDRQTREDLLQAAAEHRPVGSHGWLGPARVNAAAENFRPPMEGYYYHNLAKAFLAVEGAAAWGQNPAAASQRIERVRENLFREMSLLFASYGAHNCVGNGIGMYAPGLRMAGIVLQDRYFFDGYNGVLEEFLYNENYYDGISAEGSLNYAGMVSGMFGLWKDRLELEPECSQRHPFVNACGRSIERMRSLWGVRSQHGDGPNECFMAGSEPRRGPDGQEAREPSVLFGGFGISLARAGAPGRRLEVFLHHDRVTGHAHPDMLGVQVHYRGVPLIAFIGDARLGRFLELREDRNEDAAFMRALPYPKPMLSTDTLETECQVLQDKAENSYGAWAIGLNTITQTKNTLLIDEICLDNGRAPWRGGMGGPKADYGNLRLCKAGEAPDSPEAAVQVLEATGEGVAPLHYQGVRLFRRGLMLVTRPDGRPYVLDVFHAVGGNRHLFLWHSRGEVVASTLPQGEQEAPNLEVWLDQTFPRRRYWLNERNRNIYEHQIEKVRAHDKVPGVWNHTWNLDYAAWAPKTAAPGQQATPAEQWYERGMKPVRLRLHGVAMPGDKFQYALRAKSPFPTIVSEYSPQRPQRGMVRFQDGLDYAGTLRVDENSRLMATHVHVLEPFLADEQPTIARIAPLQPAEGRNLPPGVVGLELTFADGSCDLLAVLPVGRNQYTFKNGLHLSGRYGLLRLAANGAVLEARVVSGTHLTLKDRVLVETERADLSGLVARLEGDISGDRSASAILLQPDSAWPLDQLDGRVVTVGFNQGQRCENYVVEKAEQAGKGLVRLVLRDAPPFVDHWGRVAYLGCGSEARSPLRPNEFMCDKDQAVGKGGVFATAYLHGSRVAFLENGLALTLAGGENGGRRIDLLEDVDLNAAGVKPGSRFAIFPDFHGAMVRVAGESGGRVGADGVWQPLGLVPNRAMPPQPPAEKAAGVAPGNAAPVNQ